MYYVFLLAINEYFLFNDTFYLFTVLFKQIGQIYNEIQLVVLQYLFCLISEKSVIKTKTLNFTYIEGNK